MTPEMVHTGCAQEVYDKRQQVLVAAYRSHPERFVNQEPSPPRPPSAAWINPPSLVPDMSEETRLESSVEDSLDETWKEDVSEQELVVMSV